MRTSPRWHVAAMAFAVAFWPALTFGQAAGEPLPPGHPPVASGSVVPPLGSDASPSTAADAPPMDAGASANTDGGAPPNPHGGHAGHGDDPHGDGIGFKALPDSSEEDPALPKGTIVVSLRNEKDAPLPKQPIRLGIVRQTVAKGDKHEERNATTDGNGEVRFDQLETASAYAYRVSHRRDGASFSAMPFRMPDKGGMRVVLHAYPVTSDMREALIVTQGVSHIEVKDDRVQVQQALTFFNFSDRAWVPHDFVVSLPAEFTALNAQQDMGGTRVTSLDGRGARIDGTFPPGRSTVEFRWQLPYSASDTIEVGCGVTPQLAFARVMVAASPGVSAHVEGFSEGSVTTDGAGNRILLFEREMRRDEPAPKMLRVQVSGIPTPGPGRWIAVGAALLFVLGGLMTGFSYVSKQHKKEDRRARRKRLTSDRERWLEALLELELEHHAGDIGPKTYEAERRAIIDAIAQTIDADEAHTG